MKVGNLVNGLAVVDVKRVNKLNLIQFLKDVNSYLELGYKIDVNSGRQVGLVLMVDMYKLESNVSVGSVGDNSKDESMEDYKTRLEKEGFSTNFLDGENKEEVDMKDSEVPAKKSVTPRAKKTT